MDDIVNLCKQYGFVFPGSEIYDGFANTWDFGPVGVELKNNIKKAWWKRFVQEDMNTYGVDAAILMNPRVWEASGHVSSFSDPKMDCKKCKQRFRADNLIEDFSNGEVAAEAMSNEEMEKYINDNHIVCPNCHSFEWSEIKQFKLMFETSRGTVEGDKDTVYLRPETCQGEYFRNEITPGNFLFRTIEFEQMELQKFCHEKDSMNFFDDYKKKAMDFIIDLGLDKDKLRYHDHDKLAHYAKAACDIQYKFPIGWEELNGIHHRGTWDLSRHAEFSGEELENEAREVMHFHPAIAPYKVAILPLVKKYHKDKAEELFKMFSKNFMSTYDETGSIGKRYRRQDVIGTPYCITVDDETLNNGTVTVRDRDTMEQVTLSVEDAIKYVEDKIKF